MARPACHSRPNAPPVKSWLKDACRRSVVRRATKVSLIVGTLLSLINQGEVIFAWNISAAVMFKIVLTYAVPYSVTTYASVGALREPQRNGR